MATFDRYREMVEMGLYKPGANPDLDAAQALVQRLTPFLRQVMGDVSEPASTWQALQQVLAATGGVR
jgi:flagellum-specific ATP synthase